MCRLFSIRLPSMLFALGMLALGASWAAADDNASVVIPTDDDGVPLLTPLPKSVPVPKNNPSSPEKITLGKQLFFDPRLSGDNSMSCATCHLPEKAFGDELARAKGAGGKRLSRNTQTLLNIGFYSHYFWDGRTDSLEQQALIPIVASDEMNQDLALLEQELDDIPGYVTQFRNVFDSPVTRDGIANALAAFERTLVTNPSPFDRYLAGDARALSAEAKRGLELFVGEAGCIRCHHGPMLSDGKFYRLGVAGRDLGRGRVTGRKEDNYRFRTPSLRNVAQTGPYMHNGRLKTLTEVVTFYFRELPLEGPDQLPLDVEPLLGLSFSDISDLVAFLESLAGESTKVSPPTLP